MPHPYLAGLAQRYWDFLCAEEPLTAIRAGVPTDAEVLLRLGPDDHERRAAWARAALDEVMAIKRDELVAHDQATHALLIREFAALIELVARRAHLRPSLFPLGPEFFLVHWANSTGISTASEAQLYLARLSAIPQSFTGLRESLAQGVAQGLRYPRLVLDCEIAQLRDQGRVPAAESAFAGPLMRAAGRSPTLAALAEDGVRVIAEKVYPAFQAYADFLATDLLPVARHSLGCKDDIEGEALYRNAIRHYATLDLAPEEIHALGLAEVARITDAMLAVAAQAGFADDLSGFRRHIQTDNRQFAENAEQLREQFEILSKRIDARIPEFFGRTPRTTYGVKTIPEAIAARMPPAYAQANPANNSAAGVHWVTSLPGKCPRYMHVPLAMHEAWLGHLMHIALIQEMEQLPEFRRHGAFGYGACLEGWALYCEALAEEMGFYDSPDKLYGRYEMEMWRAVRLVVDTGIHVQGWSRQQAIDYFQTHMVMPLETIAAEVDRYIGLPGQALGYQIGNLKFKELRARAEAALGDEFRIRDFHDALMAAGPVTLPVLEDLMEDWISRQKVMA